LRAPFCRLLSKASGSHLPCAPEVPPLGFGYPFGGVQDTQPLGTSFSSQRSWASPFKAFLRLADRGALSHTSFRSRAFLQNLTALYRRLSSLIPTSQPYPQLPSRCLAGSRADLLSWASWPLGLPLRRTKERASLPFLPPTPFGADDVSTVHPRSPGVYPSGDLAISLRRGRQPV